MIDEKEYEAMVKLVSKHDSRIRTLYRLTNFSKVTILLVLIISLYPFYVTFGFIGATVVFIILFAASCVISHMIQKDNK